MTPKKRIEAAAGQLAALQSELQRAHWMVKSLEEKITEAKQALREAKIAADEHLPHLRSRFERSRAGHPCTERG